MVFVGYFIDMFELAKAGNTQGIYFFIVVYTTLVLSISLFFQYRINRWPIVKGDLLNKDVDKFGATEWATTNQEYVAEALYLYTVEGKKYFGKRVSAWVMVASHNAKFILEKQLSSIDVDDNGKVSVYYNPKKPQKSYLIITGIKSQLFTLTLILIPIIGYITKYY